MTVKDRTLVATPAKAFRSRANRFSDAELEAIASSRDEANEPDEMSRRLAAAAATAVKAGLL